MRHIAVLLIIAAMGLPAAPAAGDQPVPEQERGYDRLEFRFLQTMGLSWLPRVAPLGSSHAVTLLANHASLGWRFTDHMSVRIGMGAGALRFHYSVGVTRSPRGWAKEGWYYGKNATFLYGCPLVCDSDREYLAYGKFDAGSGPQGEIILGYRWPQGHGGWGLSVEGAIQGAYIWADAPECSGFYLGLSGVHLAIDW